MKSYKYKTVCITILVCLVAFSHQIIFASRSPLSMPALLSPKDPNQQYNFGLSFLLSSDSPKSYVNAFNYFKQAAGQGHAGALYKLGECYQNGYGTEVNPEQAIFIIGNRPQKETLKPNNS